MILLLFTFLFFVSSQSLNLKDDIQYTIPDDDPSSIIFRGTGILTSTIAKAAQNKAKIIIEEGITEIADDAFYRRIWPETENENFVYEEVKLPRSLVKIGARAFSISGRELKRVHFPDYKPEIAENDIPEEELESFYSLREIGADAFARQPLTDHNIPATYNIIGTRAFELCQLTHIRLNSKIKAIESYTFMSCDKLIEIILPTSLTNISSNAFMNCKSLRKVTWNSPEVKLFGYDAFYGCESLEEFTFPPVGSGFQQSGEYFANCFSLKRCVFPHTITGNMLGPRVFTNCRSLKEVFLPENLNTILSDFFMNSSIEIAFLPKAVNSISSNAFKDCRNLKYVHIANNEIISIEDNSFDGSPNIQTMVIDGNMTSLGRNIFVAKSICYNGILNPQSSAENIDTTNTIIYLTEKFRENNPNQNFGSSSSDFDGFPYEIQTGDVCTLPTPPPTPPTQEPLPSGDGNNDNDSSNKGISTLIIILIIVCILAVGAIISVVVAILIIREKKKADSKQESTAENI